MSLSSILVATLGLGPGISPRQVAAHGLLVDAGEPPPPPPPPPVQPRPTVTVGAWPPRQKVGRAIARVRLVDESLGWGESTAFGRLELDTGNDSTGEGRSGAPAGLVAAHAALAAMSPSAVTPWRSVGPVGGSAWLLAVEPAVVTVAAGDGLLRPRGAASGPTTWHATAAHAVACRGGAEATLATSAVCSANADLEAGARYPWCRPSSEDALDVWVDSTPCTSAALEFRALPSASLQVVTVSAVASIRPLPAPTVAVDAPAAVSVQLALGPAAVVELAVACRPSAP